MIRPPVGTLVGAHRWPWHAAHPGAWGRPWSGVVLEQDDPRAWAGTLAFPSASPDPVAVREWVAYCRAQGWELSVPVLWTFGAETRTYFERPESLRPYAEDVAEWEADRARELASSAGLVLLPGGRSAVGVAS